MTGQDPGAVAHRILDDILYDVRGGAGLRLYRAVALEHSILAKDGAPDHRVVVHLP